jgi:glycosyltransferase involved in cell wall biosynthesis
MKIAIDARIIYTSTGRYIERLLHHLQDIDTKNEYLVLLRQADFDRWVPRAANFRKVPADFAPYTVAEQTAFAQLLRRLGPDLVHYAMPNHPITYRGKHITTIHDLTLIDFVNKRREGLLKGIYKHQIKPAVFRGVMWWAATKSNAVITPTKYVREQLIRRFGAPSGRVHVTYEAADPLAAKAEPIDLGQGDNYIMYVGNAYPFKNLWTLIEAFRGLQRSDLKLVLVGKKDYFYEELERRARQQGVENVIFAGFVPDEHLAYLFEHTKLYVFPSLAEGFGLPPLEAMTYGVPVLSSNATCLPEVYGDGAEYFNPEDVPALSQHIGELLDDNKRRRELAKRGQEQLKHYSWRRMAELTLDIYNQVGRR